MDQCAASHGLRIAQTFSRSQGQTVGWKILKKIQEQARALLLPTDFFKKILETIFWSSYGETAGVLILLVASENSF